MRQTFAYVYVVLTDTHHIFWKSNLKGAFLPSMYMCAYLFCVQNLWFYEIISQKWVCACFLFTSFGWLFFLFFRRTLLSCGLICLLCRKQYGRILWAILIDQMLESTIKCSLSRRDFSKCLDNINFSIWQLVFFLSVHSFDCFSFCESLVNCVSCYAHTSCTKFRNVDLILYSCILFVTFKTVTIMCEKWVDIERLSTVLRWHIIPSFAFIFVEHILTNQTYTTNETHQQQKQQPDSVCLFPDR